MRIVELSEFASIAVYVLTVISSVFCMHIADKAHSKKIVKICLLLTVIITSVPGFFRYMVGIDYETYFLVGERIRQSNSIQFALTYWGRLEPSFGLLSYWLGKIGLTTHVGIGIYAIFTQIFMVAGIWKYRKYVNPSVAFLIYMSMFYFRTFNMFRQALAMAILLFAIHYLRDKKIWKFVVCVVLATLIHRPAIVSLLMIWYFKPIKKRTKYLDIFFCYVLPGGLAIGFEYLMNLVQYIPFLSIYIESTEKYTTFRHESLLSLGTLLLLIEITLYILHRKKYRAYEDQTVFESVLDKAMFFEVVYFILDFIAGFAARIVLYYSVSSIISLSSLYNTKASLNNEKTSRTINLYRAFVISYCIAQFVRIMLNNGYGQLPYCFWY